MSGVLLALYVFGSVARADADDQSDLDLLAVVADGRGKVADAEVLSHVPESLRGLEPSISWYGRNRLEEMFRNGELFAWHLYQEAQPIMEGADLLKELGQPAPYANALEDVISFEDILSSLPEQIRQSPDNCAYELGLIYVCLRNICMSASASLCTQPDFSRYSPFHLPFEQTPPITRAEYNLAMICRMSGQRGLEPPRGLDAKQVQEIYDRVAPWIAGVRAKLEITRGRG